MSHYNSDQYDDFVYEVEQKYKSKEARRKRKAKVVHQPKKSHEEILEEIADRTNVEGGFTISYTPARYEEEFLYDSIVTFFDRAIITDVLAKVKGGKEATVYRCEAHESTGVEHVAVKVYRPRKFRNLRNDKMYREGRKLISIDGKEIDKLDKRAMRALEAGSAYGEQLSHTSWLMHEYVTLEKLHAAGAAVPKPYAAGTNAIAMGYIGDETRAAPTLHEVRLDPDEARDLYNTILKNINIMLVQGSIHGDLSAYNILYWGGDVTIIDFPQVTEIKNNSHAHQILERDVLRVCEYFQQYGIESNVDKMVRRMWRKYGPDNPAPEEIVSTWHIDTFMNDEE